MPARPEGPRDATFFDRFADYQAAKIRHREDLFARATQIEQVENRIGYEAILQTAEDTEAAVVDACADLAEMRATTLEGLMVKARLAERGNWDELSRSIVADLLAMA